MPTVNEELQKVFEPAAQIADHTDYAEHATVSAAISLKRIADAVTAQPPKRIALYTKAHGTVILHQLNPTDSRKVYASENRAFELIYDDLP